MATSIGALPAELEADAFVPDEREREDSDLMLLKKEVLPGLPKLRVASGSIPANHAMASGASVSPVEGRITDNGEDAESGVPAEVRDPTGLSSPADEDGEDSRAPAGDS